MPSWIYSFPSCSFSCFFAAALHVVFAATCTLCSPRRRHGSALRRGVRDGVATVRETSRRSRRGVGGDGGGRSRRFSGGPALSAGLATRLSTRAIVPAVKIQKKGPLGLGRKRAVKTAGGGYYAPGAWNQVLFSDFFLPSGFSLVCPAFPETAFGRVCLGAVTPLRILFHLAPAAVAAGQSRACSASSPIHDCLRSY